MEGEDPYICAVRGGITVADLLHIEVAIDHSGIFDDKVNADGTRTVSEGVYLCRPVRDKRNGHWHIDGYDRIGDVPEAPQADEERL
jgi:hypothetical protein